MVEIQMSTTSPSSEALNSLLFWYQSLQNLLGEGRLYCQYACSYKQALDDLEVSLTPINKIFVQEIKMSPSLEDKILKHREWITW